MKRLIEEKPSVKKWIEWKEIEKIRSTYGTSILAKLDEDGAPARQVQRLRHGDGTLLLLRTGLCSIWVMYTDVSGTRARAHGP
jgi:hypothetical protein